MLIHFTSSESFINDWLIHKCNCKLIKDGNAYIVRQLVNKGETAGQWRFDTLKQIAKAIKKNAY